MTGYLDSKNFPCDSVQSRRELDGRLTALMQRDFHGDFFELMAGYQLFGYFLLLDDDWERHRQAIGLDTVNQQ